MTRTIAARAALLVHVLLLALLAAVLPAGIANADPAIDESAPPASAEPAAPVEESTVHAAPVEESAEPAAPVEDDAREAAADVDAPAFEPTLPASGPAAPAGATAGALADLARVAVPSITVTPTTGLRTGDTVTVRGTGFAPEDHPTVLGTRPPLAGDSAGVYVAIGAFLEHWRPSEGAPATARPADRAQTKWVVREDQVATIGGAAAGGVAIAADGSFELTFVVPAEIAGASPDGRLGIYSYAAGGATAAAFETATLLDVLPTPTVTATPTTGLRPGDTVTVRGTGFAPEHNPGAVATRPPLAGDYGGVYVAIGAFLEDWRPSEGAPATARPADRPQTRWVVRADQVGPIGGAPAGGVAIGADGSFEVSFVVPAEIAGASPDGRLGIYTYAGGGSTYVLFETETLLDLATPTLSVSQTTDLDPDGAEITITGRDYDTRFVAAYPRGTTNAAGVYVQIGYLDDEWRPSEGAPSTARSNAYSRWVQGAQDAPPYLEWTDHGDGTADFEWTLTITKAELDAIARDGARLAVFTVGAGGATQPVNELAVPIAFATPGEPHAPETPQQPGAEATPGSLVWGIKASFRDYVTGPIAHGTISLSGGAGANGGGYWFPQSSSDVDPATGFGSVAYRGAVRFSGHDGALTVVVADPIVTIASAGRATLSAATASGRVDFATLDLAAGRRTVDATGAVTYSAVPATLTGAGAVGFAGFYNQGAALDPVSFTIGAANPASGAGGVVAAARVANAPDPTPPATDGITVTGDLVPGGEITAIASGFEPGETGILVVIYSDPVVLASDAAADASGTVTWTGRLPAGLTGRHTITFQGSVDRGAVLDIAAAATVGCEVAGAELEWGFKEAFRAYLDGSIANGGWTTADGANYATPTFGWADGTGGYDARTDDADLSFTGSVRFTGHGGVLDTTIANPRVVIDGDRAVLLLDIAGTTRDGAPVSAQGVEFAELDLATAERSGGGDLVAFVDIPATLTAAGSAAFGTYDPGTELDPVTLQITAGRGCDAPAALADADPVAIAPEAADAGFPWPWLLVALGILVLLAIVGVVVVKRRA